MTYTPDPTDATRTVMRQVIGWSRGGGGGGDCVLSGFVQTKAACCRRQW